MKQILSFGGGVQTTALAIMAARGEIEVDEVVFADTGAEKPETYWYMEAYTLPILKEAGIPFATVHPTPHYGLSLYDYLWRVKSIPFIRKPFCRVKFKAMPVRKHAPDAIQFIGFSSDESQRAENPMHQGKQFPLIELGLKGSDCMRIISDYGWPTPTKSSCFFCPFQRPSEWNWLKVRHPELIEKALALEAQFHEKKPHLRHEVGLFGWRPLWKWSSGIQMEFDLQEYSCWSGYCGH